MAGGKKVAPGGGGAWAVDKLRYGLGALLLFCGCGYRLVTGQGVLPDGSRELSIGQARNESNEPAAGARLTDSLRREAGRAGLVVSGAAPLALEARLVKIDALVETATLVGGRYHSRQQKLWVVAEFILRGPTGIIWQERLEEREKYLSAPDLRGTEANRQTALGAALERLARAALGRVVSRY